MIFRFIKKVEHSWKALVHDGVCNFTSSLSLHVQLHVYNLYPCVIVCVCAHLWQLSLLHRTRCQSTGPVFMPTDFWSLWAQLFLKRLIVSQCVSIRRVFCILNFILNTYLFLFLSFKRSIFKEEEEFFICCKVCFSGDSVPTQRGEEGGEEGPKYGQPRWKL